MTGRVFLFTAGTSPNWDRTIGAAVQLGPLRELLPEQFVEVLASKTSGGPLYAWGAPTGAVGTIAGMSEGDVVFGARVGHVEVGAVVALVINEPSTTLSEHLWSAPNWPYVYFLHQAVFGSIPVSEFLLLLGESGSRIQGFRVSHKASALLRSAPSATAFISSIVRHRKVDTIEERPPQTQEPVAQTNKPDSLHDEAQADLIRIGNALRLSVWVASNDRSKTVRGLAFALSTIAELPFKGEPEFHRRIELIDVLWIKGSSIQAAFEIEQSTGVYSGLLRMADLITQFPNLSFPLYVVAPDADRRLVCKEIGRPAFRAHRLDQLCRFIPYSRLRDAVGDTARFGHHLDPAVIAEYSELCSQS